MGIKTDEACLSNRRVFSKLKKGGGGRDRATMNSQVLFHCAYCEDWVARVSSVKCYTLSTLLCLDPLIWRVRYAMSSDDECNLASVAVR